VSVRSSYAWIREANRERFGTKGGVLSRGTECARVRRLGVGFWWWVGVGGGGGLFVARTCLLLCNHIRREKKGLLGVEKGGLLVQMLY